MRRTGELYRRDFIPFSLFINTTNGETKIAITIKANNDDSKLSVKHWFISSCQPDSALPTLKDYTIDKEQLFYSPYTVIKSFVPIKYEYKGVRLNNNLGNGGHPMSFDLYKKSFSDLLSAKTHKLQKEIWLWRAFARCYFGYSENFILDKEYSAYHRLSLGEMYPTILMAEQQSKVAMNFKNMWKNWTLWKKHLLFDEQVAGELLFSEIYARPSFAS